MFSSPSHGPGRRRPGDGSIRSSRASTPSMIGRSTPQIGGQISSSTPFAAGKGSSFLGGNESNRRRISMRNTASIPPPSSAGDDSFDGTIGAESTRRKEKMRVAGKLLEGTVLSRDDVHSISLFAHLPMDVNVALQSVSAYEPLKGSLDPITGHAFVVTRSKCFVWNYSVRGYEAPTCFTHDLAPISSSERNELLMNCSIVPKGINREPGLLLVTPDGKVYYHDTISASLRNERRQGSSITLGAGEHVTLLHRCNPTLYIASTTQSRLVSIQLMASGGQLNPIVTIFAQPRGIFGRLFGVSANLGSSEAGIIGLTSWKNDEAAGIHEVYAVSQQSLQKWLLIDGRGERNVFDEDLRGRLIESDERITEGSQSAETLRLVDATVSKDGKVQVLYSFALMEDGALHYGIASLEENGNEITISRIASLQYSRMADIRSNSLPRLLMPNGGPVMFVIFTEAIVFKIFNSDGLEESIELRDVSSNRFFGTGSPSSDAGKQNSGAVSISVFTQNSGALLVEVDTESATSLSDLITSGEDRNVVDTHRLKARLERGVFHSDNILNPISFDLPLDIRGDLIAASEQLSDDIVHSESPSLSNALDIKSQLANRLERLHSLAAFLSLNGMMGMLTQNALRRLCADAQLVASAIDLWDYANDILRTPIRLQNVGNPLAEAIERVCQDVEDEDILRHFFRYDLRKLDAVLVQVHTIAQKTASHGISRISSVMCETNRILLTTFQAALRYRIETTDLYRLKYNKIPFEAWTCTADVVRVLKETLADTFSLIQERTRQLGNTVDQDLQEVITDTLNQADFEKQLQATLKGQLFELASHTLDAYEERLSYLRLAGSSHPSLEREFGTLKAEYEAERRNILLPLVTIGRRDRAFNLAEQHRDFEILTELCCSLPIEQQNSRFRLYLKKYGEAFAEALYTFHAQNGKMQTLLDQDDEFKELLGKFLEANPSLNRITWLHDFGIGNYDQASLRLLNEAGRERKSASSKRLILSLAKLSKVSQLSEMQIASQSEQAAIEVFDDQIDLVNVHERIRKTFARTIQENEEQEHLPEAALLESAEETVLALSGDKPAFGKLYLHLSKRLIEGHVLSSEDLIDLLSLHDANEGSSSDFALALEVFVRARDMPPARAQFALASLWRRIVLFDDWVSVTQTKDTADSVLAARLRSTVLYSTLFSAAGTEATSAAILDPMQTLIQPTRELIQARLSTTLDLGSDQQDTSADLDIDELVQESQSEVAILEDIMNKVDFSLWFAEVKRLVEESLGQQDQQLDDIDFAGSSNADNRDMMM